MGSKMNAGKDSMGYKMNAGKDHVGDQMNAFFGLKEKVRSVAVKTYLFILFLFLFVHLRSQSHTLNALKSHVFCVCLYACRHSQMKKDRFGEAHCPDQEYVHKHTHTTSVAVSISVSVSAPVSVSVSRAHMRVHAHALPLHPPTHVSPIKKIDLKKFI